MFVVIDSQAGPPDEATRKALQGCYTELRDIIRAAVHVVEGEGFVSAAKRGALTLLNLTAKPPFPTRIAATLDEGALTMRKVLGPLWNPEMQPRALSAAMLQLRAPLMRG
jgi:hypothetical protein